jgi:rhodanese-related sulfurtransferase
MPSSPLFFLASGIAGAAVSIYSFAKYYALSGIGALDADEAAKFLKDDRVKYIIDVRTLMEWNMGHHKDAIHVPVTEFRADHPKFRNISRAVGVLLYCNTGQRARYAAELMRSYGFKNVYYLTTSFPY